MNTISLMPDKYTSSYGKTFKGFIGISDGYLTFNNKGKIILKLDKEEISSFRINNNLFTKNILIRAQGTNHKFQIKSNKISQIINFLKN